MKYYLEELEKVSNALMLESVPPKFKVTGGDATTKWLDLNDESAAALIRWLEIHYKTREINISRNSL